MPAPGWPAVLALAPLLGPGGWVRFGVALDGRDSVVFDPATCGVRVGRLDLDAGAEGRDVYVARVWEGEAWRWEGVAGVADTMAGGAPARGARGPFSIAVEAGKEEVRGVDQDGRTASWRWDAGRLLGVTGPDGVRTTYGYGEGGRLASIAWPDGSAVEIGPGRIGGSFGAWTCAVAAGRADIVDPSGGHWRVTTTPGESVLVDPTGSTWRTLRTGGRLAGWVDARGGQVSLSRDAAGAVVGAVDPAGGRWGAEWVGGRLTALTTPAGARWGFGRDPRGGLTRRTDPIGRVLGVVRDELGAVRGVTRGGGSRTVGRDGRGRVVADTPPGSLKVEAQRDARGRVARILDPSGAVWVFSRDDAGWIVGLTDPLGARWSIRRDRVGRPVGVTEPSGRSVDVTRRGDGRITRIEAGPGARWELLRGADGWLSAVRDPAGQRTGWLRDAVGRITTVLLADGAGVRVERDAAGNVLALGEVRIERDAVGRARRMSRGDGRAVEWARDSDGRVVGVRGAGLGIRLERASGGEIGAVEVDGASPWTLRRDGAGRVVGVDGPGAVDVARDGAGRVVGLTPREGEQGGVALRVDRDLRGLVAGIRAGRDAWRLRRDAAGRGIGVAAPGGVEIGVDRDGAGRPVVVRFPEGWVARHTEDAGVSTVRLQDPDGSPAGSAAWAVDTGGRVIRRVTDADWVYRRDPIGALATVESAAGAWSRSPDRLEGPGGFEVRYSAAGRPERARLGPEGALPWGLGGRELAYTVDADGAVTGVTAGAERRTLGYDGAGRLVGWGPDARVDRDALGRLVRVGGVATIGWESVLSVGGEVRAALPGIGVARRGAGVLVDALGHPILALHVGPLSIAPGGFAPGRVGEDPGAGERFVGGPGWPLLDRLGAVDPLSGLELGPTWTWPWEGLGWEVTRGVSPWPDPDAAVDGAWWDPERLPPETPDLLRLLVAAGELEAGGPRGPTAPGLPWLPASFAADPPVVVPDPDVVVLDEDPLVERVWRAAHPPVEALAPEDVARVLFADELRDEMAVAGGFLPDLPAGLR